MVHLKGGGPNISKRWRLQLQKKTKRQKVSELLLHLSHFACVCMRLLADQTPTPTRFLQNCEEVGLFKEIEEEFLQEQEEEKNKEVHIYKERYRHHFHSLQCITLCSDWPTPEWSPLLLWLHALLPGKHILPFQTFHVDLTHFTAQNTGSPAKKNGPSVSRLSPPTRFSPITGSPV